MDQSLVLKGAAQTARFEPVCFRSAAIILVGSARKTIDWDKLGKRSAGRDACATGRCNK